MMNYDDSWFLVISWSLFEVYRRDYLLVDIFKADVSGLSLGSRVLGLDGCGHVPGVVLPVRL